MEDTVSVWGIPQAVHPYEKVQGSGGPWRGPPQGDNYSSNFDTYGNPTKWTVMLEKKRVCNMSVFAHTQTWEKYVHTDGQTVYLWDQTTRTPSLANLLIQTTPPGTLFMYLLHLMVSYTDRLTVYPHGLLTWLEQALTYLDSTVEVTRKNILKIQLSRLMSGHCNAINWLNYQKLRLLWWFFCIP